VVRGFEGVADCAAIGVPATFGEDDVMVVVETADGTSVDPAALHEWLQTRLPKFMVPRYIDVAPLPRNATTQRVKKFELRSRGVTATTWEANA
jgi:crotonobetaine/carnitine-CoA ligase